MKNSYKILVLFSIILCLGAQDVMAQSIFPDKNLEKVVRRYVFSKRNNEEPLTEQDVENISSIEGNGAEITDLTGLDKCRSLALLSLSKNQITDISAIKDLKGLQSLNLAENQITDVSPVATLTNLQYLKLSANQLTDITPLKELSALRSLYLSDNALTDLTRSLSASTGLNNCSV